MPKPQYFLLYASNNRHHFRGPILGISPSLEQDRGKNTQPKNNGRDKINANFLMKVNMYNCSTHLNLWCKKLLLTVSCHFHTFAVFHEDFHGFVPEFLFETQFDKIVVSPIITLYHLAYLNWSLICFFFRNYTKHQVMFR